MRDRIRSLTQINLDDLTSALGVQDRPLMGRFARALLRRPAVRFAEQMADFDRVTGDEGLPEGARHAERILAKDVTVFGRELLPAGAFLALSNHPGLTDTLALFAALDRRDLRVIALDRPFLQNLINVSKQLLSLPDDVNQRAALVREAARALRAGTPILTFPAGHIEPDPDVFPGAVESLATWTPSAEVFVRLAPAIPVLPVLVRGVTWNAAAHLWLTRLRRTPEGQQLLASALQLLWQLTFNARPVSVTVQIGTPIRAEGGSRFDAAALHSSVLREMRAMIQNLPVTGGVSAL